MLRVSSRRRWLVLVAGLTLLASLAWLAVQVWRSRQDPAGFRAWDGSYAWIVGPPPSALTAEANRRIDEAVEVLNDSAVDPTRRLEAYRDHLRAAERLQIHSLRARPAQALGLARLAMIRWELDPPLSEGDLAELLSLIDLASRMAPGSPRVHVTLGRLLLAMGRPEEAVPRLRYALELDPALARQTVEMLAENFLLAEEIHQALPGNPAILVALSGPFHAEGKEDRYREILEESLDLPVPPTPPLLRTYGSACLRAGEKERLLERMGEVGPWPEDPELEAERLLQRARAAVRLGLTEQALTDARLARATYPESPTVDEQFGRIALAAGEPSVAAFAFRDALGKVARASGSRGWRARLYRQIGQALDAQDKAHLAYDAYRRALELNPSDRHAHRRLEAMKSAAGVR